MSCTFKVAASLWTMTFLQAQILTSFSAMLQALCLCGELQDEEGFLEVSNCEAMDNLGEALI